jgi:hypothetical protein
VDGGTSIARLVAVLGRLTERDRSRCAVSSRTIVCSPPHRWPTSASPGNGEPGCASPSCTPSTCSTASDPAARGNPAPFHWVLGPLGAALVAAEPASTSPTSTGGAASSTTSPPANASAHLVGLNGFFTALLRSARTRPGCSLDEWWSERRCAREWGEVVRPDGYGRLDRARHHPPVPLEHDNGTERLARLAAKLDGYARLAAAAGHPNWVLFTFPGPRREADARRVLAPDEALWLPIGDPGPRCSLVQLAGFPFDRGRPPSPLYP